jgi:hypothetical protein
LYFLPERPHVNKLFPRVPPLGVTLLQDVVGLDILSFSDISKGRRLSIRTV